MHDVTDPTTSVLAEDVGEKKEKEKSTKQLNRMNHLFDRQDKRANIVETVESRDKAGI